MAVLLSSVWKNVQVHNLSIKFPGLLVDKFSISSVTRSAVSASSNLSHTLNGSVVNFGHQRRNDHGSTLAGSRLRLWCNPTSALGTLRFFTTGLRPELIVGRSGLVSDPLSGHLLDSRLGWMMHNQRRMAGHNKWSNIKHIKGAKDAARATLFMKLGRQIKLAMQGGKSNDPKFNIDLAHAVDQAKQANMPIAKIEAMLKNAEANKELMVPFSIEARGPGGCFIIVETLTDSVNRTKSQIKHIMSKCGAAVVDGSVQHAFSYKGTINVDASTSKLDVEKAVELAIEVGAEEVIEAAEDDGLQVFQFLSDPKEYFNVKNELTTRGYDLKSTGLSYIPTIKVALSDDQLDLMSRLFESLNEHPDVVKFYENVE